MTLSPRPWRDDGRLDRRAGDDGLTQTDAFAFADHQHLIENDFRADVRRYLFYLEFFAGGNLVLLAAGFYDRVHGGTPLVDCSRHRGDADRLHDRSALADRGKP